MKNMFRIKDVNKARKELAGTGNHFVSAPSGYNQAVTESWLTPLLIFPLCPEGEIICYNPLWYQVVLCHQTEHKSDTYQI